MNEEIQTKSVSRFLIDNRSLSGFETSISSAFQVIREGIENNLDSCERSRVLPDITLTVKKLNGYHQITCTDNGLGMHDSDIPRAFGTVLTSSKYLNRQDRGIFGLGIKVALAHAQVTTNQPFIVASSRLSNTGKISKISIYKLRINLQTNEPIIDEHRKENNPRRWHGLILKFKIGNVDFDGAKHDIIEYLNLTHAICPYASIKFTLDDKEYLYPRKLNVMPQPARETLFHPYDVDLIQLQGLAQESKSQPFSLFLQKNFQRVGNITAQAFCKFAKINPDKDIKEFKHEELFALKNQMSKYTGWNQPSVSSLSLIEEKCFAEGIKELTSVDYYAYSSRRNVFSGSAFAVEVCGVVTKEKPKNLVSDKLGFKVRRIVNKIPLIEDYQSCLLQNVFKGINWYHYNIDVSQYDLVFYVHLCSSSKRTLFKDLRKGMIADIPEIRNTLDLTIKDVLRKMSVFVSNRQKIEYDRKRLSKFAYYISIISNELAFITKNDSNVIEQKLKESLLKE